MKLRKFLPTLIYIVALSLAFSWVTGAFSQRGNKIPYSKVLELFRQEQVSTFNLHGSSLTMELHNPYNGDTDVQTKIADPEAFRQEIQPLLDEQTASGVLSYYDFVAEAEPTAFSLVMPLLIVGLILLILWAILMGRFNASNPMASFGKARAVP